MSNKWVGRCFRIALAAKRSARDTDWSARIEVYFLIMLLVLASGCNKSESRPTAVQTQSTNGRTVYPLDHEPTLMSGDESCSIADKGPFLASGDCGPSPDKIAAQAPLTVLHGTTGVAILHLTNSQATDAHPSLTAGPFFNQCAQSPIPDTKITVTAVGGGSQLPTVSKNGGSTDVLANISNYSAVGVGVARLFDHDRCVGELALAKYESPLNFSVDGDGSGSSILQILESNDVVVGLKNNDDIDYPVAVSLSAAGKETPAQSITIARNTSTLLSFVPLPAWFNLETWFRNQPTTIYAVVRLSIPNPSGRSNWVAPIRKLPLNAKLFRFSPLTTQWLSFSVVFIVLLLGGLASLAINTLLPNVIKKLSYRKKIQELATATSAVSTQVDSRLRVLLRLERVRLQQLLVTVDWATRDVGDIFQQVEVGIYALSKRLMIAQRLDDLRNRFELRSAACPTSVSDSIDEHLEEAADQMRSLFPTDASVDNANVSLNEAEKLLNSLEDSKALAQDIATRHKQLKDRVATFPPGIDLDNLRTSLPGLFLVLNQTYDDANPVVPGNFMEVDDSIAGLNIAYDYLYIGRTTIDNRIQQRLGQRISRLTSLLGTRDWRSLRSARDLVQQMRQNIYVEDLIEELKLNRACITVDQQVARVYQPLQFCICFNNYTYNHAKAIEELEPTWEFSDHLTETGWTVCHFFQNPGSGNVTSKIPLSSTQLPLANTVAPATAEFTKSFSVKFIKDAFNKPKFFAEFLRFTIAFLLALISLVAGAQDQLAKLDVLPALVAVFLLGFGADAIKNLLAQPSQTVSAPAKS